MAKAMRLQRAVESSRSVWMMACMIPTTSPLSLKSPPPELPLQAATSAWINLMSTVWRKVFVFPKCPKDMVGPQPIG